MVLPVPTRARGPVLAAVLTLAVALGVTAAGYGYHRDELYFRMLPPAWGHLDQPPLTPMLAHGISAVVDQPWALRIPAIVAACVTVVLVARIAWEVGGGRFAQALAAWGTAFGTFTLSFGHVLLTASIDMVFWVAVVLCAVRACLRSDPRWWLIAGAVAGVATYNKLLILVLLAALAIGLAIGGPREELRSPHLWGGVAIAAVIASPNLIYQALNGMPQLAMGQALAQNNGAEVRVQMWPFLLVLLGPPLVPMWIAGLVGLLRRSQWRQIRFLAVAFAVVLLFTFVGASQLYYPVGLLVCLYALGCVPVAEWVARRAERARSRRRLVVAAVLVNSLVAVVVALPVIPAAVIGRTPIPWMSQLVADQIGWPEYAAQLSAAVTDADADVVITSNYGEAGALDRYGSGGAPVVSGQNALAELARPPDDARVVVVVGSQYPQLQPMFGACEVVGALDNGLGVDNEEQGQPVAVCTDPVASWDELWPQVAHLD